MTADDEPSFLGTGWAFPVDTTGGAVDLAGGERAVEESIRVILGTAKGERVMRPDFGCGVHEYAFETFDTSRRTLVEQEVEEALREWEPRIAVESVTASTDRLAEGRLDVEVEYRVRRTNEAGNLVYPFYVGGE